ncbi:MAG: aldehyde dehydrogenase family protein, partial [Rhodanobacteraceae bacterium]
MPKPQTLANLIDGRMQAPINGQYLDVFEPATGALLAHCPRSNVDDANAAFEAATRAAPAWA